MKQAILNDPFNVVIIDFNCIFDSIEPMYLLIITEDLPVKCTKKWIVKYRRA